MVIGKLRPKFSEAGKVGANPFRIFLIGRHGHESPDFEMGQGGKRGKTPPDLVDRKPKFSIVTRDIDLQEHFARAPQFPGNAADLLGEVEGIHAVNEGTVRNDFPDFILLQMPDEMPLDRSR